MRKKFSNKILLTGAGFTKNFGGFLAKEMWAKIFNNPKLHSKLKPLLLTDFDYESIYHKVITGKYSKEEKNSINDTIFKAYKILDDICRDWTFHSNASYPVNIYGLNKFIGALSGNQNEIGLFFTLNQDLFIERHFDDTYKMLIHPGVNRIPNQHKIISRLPLDREDFVRLPTDNEIKNNKVNWLTTNTQNYIKLHGSFGWLSSDGNNCYVIGKNKEKQLADEPLLSWYFDLFSNSLMAKNKKLFIIGYGFRDKHINNVIADSVSNFGLKLYVVSPLEHTKFIESLSAAKYGKLILKGLDGYFPYSLLDVFPKDQSDSHALIEILTKFLN